MADLSSQKYINIARPYAIAAFYVARDSQSLMEWKSFLESAAQVVKNPSVSALLAHPEISAKKILDLFLEVLAPLLNTERKNFLALLTQNHRLVMLPQILELFTIYYRTLEKISKVRIVTAVDVEDAYRQKLIQALSKRIHHEVTLHCDVDPSILGGAVIHMGDRVIDGSIRGKLTRLLQNLTG